MQAEYFAEIAENADIGAKVSELVALDNDTDSELVYDIIAGNTDQVFSIEPKTGQLKVERPLDYESIKVTQFHSILPTFYRVLLGFIKCYWVLLGYTRFLLLLLGSAGHYWVIMGFYRVLLGFTGFCLVLLGYTCFLLLLLGSAGYYRVVIVNRLGFTQLYLVLLRSTGFTGFSFRVLDTSLAISFTIRF